MNETPTEGALVGIYLTGESEGEIEAPTHRSYIHIWASRDVAGDAAEAAG
ncbi:hypothetical protein [Streptomyces sp. NBC_00829]|nr:hypothetical protein OG293_08820 [Streptomyces sp. NBC_00829]